MLQDSTIAGKARHDPGFFNLFRDRCSPQQREKIYYNHITIRFHTLYNLLLGFKIVGIGSNQVNIIIA